jgi:membrane-associated protease RseP (regulator of RpoE activity)
MAEREALLPERASEKEAPLPGTLGPLRPPLLNLVLFALTGLSAFVMAAQGVLTDTRMVAQASGQMVQQGFWFAGSLLAILLSHEMGHFLLARKHGVDATWPFFLPAPLISMIGTLGAVIKLRSMPRTRQALIDIGAAGPLLGFVVTVPLLVVGVSLSPVLPDEKPVTYWSLAMAIETMVRHGHWPGWAGLDFGQPLAMLLIERLVHGPIPPGHSLALHPIAVAGWFGLLLTALNLLPLGQLDGGHLLYGASPRWHRALAAPLSGILLGLGVFSPFPGWVLWGLLTGLWFNRHPRLADPEPHLDGWRRLWLFAALLVFLLSFVAAPLKPVAGS